MSEGDLSKGSRRSRISRRDSVRWAATLAACGALGQHAAQAGDNAKKLNKDLSVAVQVRFTRLAFDLQWAIFQHDLAATFCHVTSGLTLSQIDVRWDAEPPEYYSGAIWRERTTRVGVDLPIVDGHPDGFDDMPFAVTGPFKAGAVDAAQSHRLVLAVENLRSYRPQGKRRRRGFAHPNICRDGKDSKNRLNTSERSPQLHNGLSHSQHSPEEERNLLSYDPCGVIVTTPADRAGRVNRITPSSIPTDAGSTRTA